MQEFLTKRGFEGGREMDTVGESGNTTKTAECRYICPCPRAVLRLWFKDILGHHLANVFTEHRKVTWVEKRHRTRP